MKRSDIYNLTQGIKSCGNLSNSNIEFAYRLIAIDEELKKNVEQFEKSRPTPSDKYKEFFN